MESSDALHVSGTHQDAQRLLVVSLDGTPHSLIRQRAGAGKGPWPALIEGGSLHRIHSSLPEYSSVAWASYLTGAEPAEHGVFGFAEAVADPNPRLVYPNGHSLALPTLFEKLDERGESAISVNVPMTEPPRPLRGLHIGGFLETSLEKNIHPPSLLPELERMGYVIDTDPALAYHDRDRFLDELEASLAARRRVFAWALERYPWRLAHLHVMETDRLFHFFWGEDAYAARFEALLAQVEALVAEVAERAQREGAGLVLLSDHGFTRTHRVVQLNALLELAGLLRYESGAARSPYSVASTTRAHALSPGRIYLGRPFARNTAPPGPDPALLEELQGILLDLRDPSSGERVFAAVHRGDELYAGPHRHRAPDLLAQPSAGYDIKADFAADRVFHRPETLVGCHTWQDAFFYLRGVPAPRWQPDAAAIHHAGAHVASLLGLDEPPPLALHT